MTTLQIKLNDASLYKSLDFIAKKENCSISQEVEHILNKYFSKPEKNKITPIDEFLNLSYKAKRDADEIINEIYSNRVSGKSRILEDF